MRRWTGSAPPWQPGDMPQIQGDPRLVQCPTCNAQPGQPCNAPTDDGRRNVKWYHLAREGAARIPQPTTD